jgi:hypothetical protein
VEHLRSKQRSDGSQHVTHETLTRDSRTRLLSIRIVGVVVDTVEDAEDTGSDKD